MNDLLLEPQEAKTQARSGYVLEAENKELLAKKVLRCSATGLTRCSADKPPSYLVQRAPPRGQDLNA